jgi:hypothetical protein
MLAIAGIRAPVGAPDAGRPAAGITAGLRQGSAADDSAVARAPPLSVSHASAGQVRVRTADTTSDPTEPCSASRQSTGVAAGEMSLQLSPERPMITTGWTCAPPARPTATDLAAGAAAAAAAAGRVPGCALAARALAGVACAARATRPARTARTAVSSRTVVGFTSFTVSAAPGPRAGLAAPVSGISMRYARAMCTR